MPERDFDVLIIGAGVSGIGAACRLRQQCPQKSFAILERRQAMGGTWDLFRYPGIRSDSDVLTFGYDFRPWRGDTVLADGASIKRYVEETAQEYAVDQHIHFQRRVVHAAWQSSDARWHLDVRNEDSTLIERYSARFVIGCTGYYDYDAGFRPQFPGEDRYKGRIVHPQHWPDDLDHAGKRVVIIGSGATAVTLAPALAGTAQQVTLLQRSPSYIMTLPSTDRLSRALHKVLPERWVYGLARARNIWLARMFFKGSRRWPNAMRKLLVRAAKSQLGPDFDMRHFTPRYKPWDERVCFVPDGDLFTAIEDGSIEVVTERIRAFTADGVLLQSGKKIPADVVVMATGLNVQMLGGATIEVDGAPVKIPEKLVYKAVMVEGVPNAAMIFGYTNATWTLKVNIACDYICRLLNHMDAHGYTKAVPRDTEGCQTGESVFGGLTAGYVRRAAGALPRQGSKAPWRVLHDFPQDRRLLCKAPIADDKLHFSRQTGGQAPGG